MSRKGIGFYPEEWPVTARSVKEQAGWRCVRCDHPHDPPSGYTLTVHHLDLDKGNLSWWNLAALCQRCHLHIQSRVVMERAWVMGDHTAWFKPYAGGYFAYKYLALDLSREDVMRDLEWWSSLERRHVVVRS